MLGSIIPLNVYYWNAMINDDLIYMDDDLIKFSVSDVATQVAAGGIKQAFDSWNQHPIPGKSHHIIPNFVSSQATWVIPRWNLPKYPLNRNVLIELTNFVFRERCTRWLGEEHQRHIYSNTANHPSNSCRCCSCLWRSRSTSYLSWAIWSWPSCQPSRPSTLDKKTDLPE